MDATLKKINRAVLKFLSLQKPEQTYKLIAQKATQLVGADCGILYLRQNNHFVPVASFPGDFLVAYYPRPRGLTFRAFNEKKTFLMRRGTFRQRHPKLFKFGFKSAFYIPISDNQKTIGTLTLISKKEDHFLTQDRQLLKIFGTYASLAIRKSQLIKETQDALKVQDQFLSFAGHELKTPLTSLSGYIQLLYRHWAGEPTPEGHWIEELWLQNQRLVTIVKELIEVGRVKNGQLLYDLTPCHLKKDILEPASNHFQQLYPHRKLTIIDNLGQTNDLMIADCPRILQVISHLFENSIRFSPENSPVKLTIQKQKSFLQIEIQDQRQLPPKNLAAIFDGNSDVGNTTGLLLSKYIVKHHHGLLTAKTQDSGGAIIELKLPCSR